MNRLLCTVQNDLSAKWTNPTVLFIIKFLSARRAVLFHVVLVSLLLGVDVGVALKKTDCIRFGKYASLFAFGIAIAPETLFRITVFSLQRQLRFFQFALRFLFDFVVPFCYLLRKCGLLAHHLGSIFEKLLHRKTFRFMLRMCDFSGTVYRCPRWIRFQSRWNAALCRQ